MELQNVLCKQPSNKALLMKDFGGATECIIRDIKPDFLYKTVIWNS